MKDAVLYFDTDSLFYSIESIVEHHCGLDKWNSISDEEKVKYCKRISNIITEYVNKKAFEETQQIDYNSQEKDFKIDFKQEIISKSGIFVAKKKYSLLVIDEEGVSKDEIKTKGLEIIQSSCPSAVKEKLKDLVSCILRDSGDQILSEKIKTYTKELQKAFPEEIALNIGVNSISKYHKDGVPVKGAPYHIKGLLNYRKLIKDLGIWGTVPELSTGMKVKTVYLQDNKYEFDTMSFIRWPKEFTKAGIVIDYTKMIQKTFISKIETLLVPIGKTHLLEGVL